MNIIKAIATIIRIPNTLFILLCQIFVYYFLIIPYCHHTGKTPLLSPIQNFYLAISTALIASAGYMINDYFDIKIDEINKPKRVTISLVFNRRWIIAIHVIINFIALCLAYYLSKASGHTGKLIIIQLLSILLLILYSAKWKSQAYIGNIVIALLSLMSVWLPFLYSVGWSIPNDGAYYYYLIFYCSYAFLLTWIREIIKDLEDIKGDIANGCKTMPIQYGVSWSKKLTLLLTITTLILTIIFLSLFNWSRHLFFHLSILLIITPSLIYLIYKIYHSSKLKEFKHLSRLVKITIFVGIFILCLIQSS